MVSRAIFDGDVIRGRQYILVDDVKTSAGTLAELRLYIESKGGEVVAVSTLGVSRNAIIASRPQTLTKITGKHNEKEFTNILQEFDIAGGRIGNLT